MTNLALPCTSNPKFAQRLGSHPWMRKCRCSCWLAAIYVFGNNMTEEGGGPGTGFTGTLDIRLASIRSESPAGTVITIPLNSAGWVGNLSINLTVGLDTGGSWIKIGGGTNYTILLASYMPGTSPDYCRQPEYGAPLSFSNPGFGFGETALTPGPVKWRSALTMALAEIVTAGTWATPVLNQYGTASLTKYAYCDPPVTFETPLPATNTCNINVYDQPTRKKHSFNNAVFTTPTGPLHADGSDTFNLDVTFINPFTGNLIDGSHPFNDTQELDIDTVPEIKLSSPIDGDEAVFRGSITRLGFAHYRINNVGFFCHKGLRKFEVYPDHEITTLIGVSKFPIASAVINLLVGAAEVVDVLPPGTAPNYPTPLTASQPMADHGGNIKARILDDVGNFLLYNVVDGATNIVVPVLSEPGTNFYGSPTLVGTTSVPAVDGIAEFSDLGVKGLGKHYRVTFTSSGLTESGNANRGHIDLNIACALAFEAVGPVTAGATISIKVDVVDYTGAALVPSTADALTLSGSGSFSGFGSQTPSGGVATFTGSFPSPGTYVIQVVTSGANYDGPGTAGIAVQQLTVVVS